MAIEATSFLLPFNTLQCLPLSPLTSHIIGEGIPSQEDDRPIRVSTFNLRYSFLLRFPQVSPISDGLDLNLSSLNMGAVPNRIINEKVVSIVRNTSAVPSELDAIKIITLVKYHDLIPSLRLVSVPSSDSTDISMTLHKYVRCEVGRIHSELKRLYLEIRMMALISH